MILFCGLTGVGEGRSLLTEGLKVDAIILITKQNIFYFPDILAGSSYFSSLLVFSQKIIHCVNCALFDLSYPSGGVALVIQGLTGEQEVKPTHQT